MSEHGFTFGNGCGHGKTAKGMCECTRVCGAASTCRGLKLLIGIVACAALWFALGIGQASPAYASLFSIVGSSNVGYQDSSAASSTDEPTSAASSSASAETSSFVDSSQGVLYDDENCSITLTGIETDNYYYALDVTLVNKTADKNLAFTVDYANVDGWSMNPYFYEDVAPGAQAVSQIELDLDDLDEAGITEPTSIQVELRVSDSDDYSADDFVDGTFTIYPQGKAAAKTIEREAQPGDVTLVESDELSVVLVGYSEDVYMGFGAQLYIQNRTDSNLTVSIQDAAINDVMCDPYWSTSLMPDTQAMSTVNWSDISLGQLGIDDYGAITNVDFLIRAYDNDTYDDILESTTVTLYPQGEENAAEYEYIAQPTDITLVDDDFCTATVVGCTVDDYGEFVVRMIVMNKTDANVTFSIKDATINGTMCDPYFADSIMPGKMAIEDVSWSSYFLEDIGISDPSEVSDITFTMNVYNADDWSESDYENVPCVLQVSEMAALAE